jgi:protein-S-isoprenylcysteine O-methyltransferase Ste14
MEPELPEPKKRSELALPRWAIPLVWAVIVLVIQILLPSLVAKIGPRFGWSRLAPAWWNLAGLVTVAVGLALYGWCLALHFGTYRAPVRIGFTPPHLVGAGPYKVSRNPMYVSGLLVWLGWAVFYGSPAVFGAMVLLWAVFSFRVIPHEERQLGAQFGEDYRAYKRSVRRWIGRF